MGQNTTLNLCIFSWAWRLCAERRDLWTGGGGVAGLLLYKPQFGIPLLGLLLLRRLPLILCGAALSAAGLYLAVAAVGGLGWPAWWWSQIGAFHEMDQDVNAANSVGVLGFLEALLGPGEVTAVVPGILLSVGLVFGLMALWVTDRVDEVTRWGLTAVGLVLVPPYSMFYDAGIAALALAVWADRDRNPWGPVAVWSAGFLTPLSALFSASPLFPVVLAIGSGVALSRPPAREKALLASDPQ